MKKRSTKRATLPSSVTMFCVGDRVQAIWSQEIVGTVKSIRESPTGSQIVNVAWNSDGESELLATSLLFLRHGSSCPPKEIDCDFAVGDSVTGIDKIKGGVIQGIVERVEADTLLLNTGYTLIAHAVNLSDKPAPVPEPAPHDFKEGDRVRGQLVKNGKLATGFVEYIGRKYLVLDGNRSIKIEGAIHHEGITSPKPDDWRCPRCSCTQRLIATKERETLFCECLNCWEASQQFKHDSLKIDDRATFRKSSGERVPATLVEMSALLDGADDRDLSPPESSQIVTLSQFKINSFAKIISCETLLKNKIKGFFVLAGMPDEWVATGGRSSSLEYNTIWARAIVPLELWQGPTYEYNALPRLKDGRMDQVGQLVQHQKRDLVLTGKTIELRCEAAADHNAAIAAGDEPTNQAASTINSISLGDRVTFRQYWHGATHDFEGTVKTLNEPVGTALVAYEIPEHLRDGIERNPQIQAPIATFALAKVADNPAVFPGEPSPGNTAMPPEPVYSFGSCEFPNPSKTDQLLAQIAAIQAGGTIAPDHCWIEQWQRTPDFVEVRYKARGAIFPGKRGGLVSSQYIGKRGSPAHSSAVDAVDRRNRIAKLQKELEKANANN